LVEFLENCHLSGYGGDVWFPQPASTDHLRRFMPFNSMTPHYSGTSIDAQIRYSIETKQILEDYLNNLSIREDCIIISRDKLADQYNPDVDSKKRNLDY